MNDVANVRANAEDRVETFAGQVKDEVDGKIADVWASDATRAEKQLSWGKWAERLDAYLTQLHRVLWPELIVIGGGVVKHSEKYLDRISPGCEVRIAELGNLAGIVGAALTADAASPEGS